MCYFKSVPMQRYPLKNANRNRPQRYTDSFLFQGLDVMVIAAMWRFIKSRATCILHFIGFCCKSAFSHKSCHTGDIIPIFMYEKTDTFIFTYEETALLSPKHNKANGRDRIRGRMSSHSPQCSRLPGPPSWPTLSTDPHPGPAMWRWVLFPNSLWNLIPFVTNNTN